VYFRFELETKKGEKELLIYFFIFQSLEKRQHEHEEVWRKLEELHLKHNQKLVQQQQSNKRN
jgi:hypothetical protein